MKYIIAIIQPHKLEAAKQALEDVGVNLITVSSALGRGRQKGITEIYRGAREVGLLKKIKIETAVNEDFVEPAIRAIETSCHTGQVGDGKIFVLDLGECIRIGTGERGNVAIG